MNQRGKKKLFFFGFLSNILQIEKRNVEKYLPAKRKNIVIFSICWWHLSLQKYLTKSPLTQLSKPANICACLIISHFVYLPTCFFDYTNNNKYAQNTSIKFLIKFLITARIFACLFVCPSRAGNRGVFKSTIVVTQKLTIYIRN